MLGDKFYRAAQFIRFILRATTAHRDPHRESVTSERACRGGRPVVSPRSWVQPPRDVPTCQRANADPLDKLTSHARMFLSSCQLMN